MVKLVEALLAGARAFMGTLLGRTNDAEREVGLQLTSRLDRMTLGEARRIAAHTGLEVAPCPSCESPLFFSRGHADRRGFTHEGPVGAIELIDPAPIAHCFVCGWPLKQPSTEWESRIEEMNGALDDKRR